MRKFLLSFLLVTTATIPAAAQAQREDYAQRSGERGIGRGERSNNGWRGQRAQQSVAQPQAQSQPSAPQPQVAERRNWQSRGVARGNDSMTTATPESRRWDRSGGDWNNRDGQRRSEHRGDDGQRRFGWNRGTSQPTPPPIAVPQQPRQDWNTARREQATGRDRTNSHSRWDGDRRDGNRDRWDNDNRRDRDERRYAYRNRDNNQWHNRSWYDNDDRFDRWNNNWRRDRRYDWRNYRNHNRDYYRLPRYAHPYGYSYGYRRFSIGIFLDNLFYSDRYWINDPWEYRLPPAYGPYRWVRYYDDVLLVDLRNGRVVDVIYDFFW